MKTPILLAALVAAALAVPASAQTTKESREAKCGPLPALFAAPAYVGDGDTIYSPDRRPIRLWGVDSPELRDPAKVWTVPGMRARAFLADLLKEAKNEVICKPLEWDAYCRMVSACSAKNAKTGTPFSLSMEILKAGYGMSFYLDRKPADGEEAAVYAHAEYEARRERRGLWPLWLGEAK